jgi:hypothetical protein
MLFYETIEKMPTFVESYPAMAGFSSTTSWHNIGVAGFESSHKLINFGVR